MDAERFFVVTGGPGSGKSKLIDMLRARGFATAPEAGRGVIRAQRDVEGPALPWRDPSLFAELMLCWDMRSHVAAREAPGPVFFDRGVPDTIGYLRLVGLPVPRHGVRAAETVRYNRRVFLAPFWPQIFRQDAERRQTAQEAERTCAVMADVYAEFGYEPVPLPFAPVEEQLRFILSGVGL